MIDRYFQTIDTEDKAYWLGFLYADGCVSNNLKHLIVELSITDIGHIEKFKNQIQAEQKIFIKENMGKPVLARIDIGCKTMCNDLINKGCVPCKSLVLTFPDENILPKNLVRHFIRGYFDGDGCLFATYRQLKNRPNPILQCELNFLGTYDMLYNIKKHINMDDIKILKVGNIYKIRIQSRQKIVQICNYLYEDSCFYLERKYDKYIQQIKI